MQKTAGADLRFFATRKEEEMKKRNLVFLLYGLNMKKKSAKMLRKF